MAKIDKHALKEAAYSEKSRTAITNMAYKDNPPPFISFIGPESSGKSTLLRSIVRHYWKKECSIQGPVTMKIGHKRFTFYESTNSLENTIDTIKVSDMIVLIINLEVGLQRETLETLNMINSQGVPKLCFVLTRYDERKSNKASKEITKRIQKEFSYPMKFFCMDKDIEDSTYNKIDKFVRYIETMKYRPIEWKCVHPHIVVDKIRNGFVYGYARGGPMHFRFDAHIPGRGDKTISDIEIIRDPCDLGSRSNVLYIPMGNEVSNEESSSSTAEAFEISDPEIKLFDDEDARNFVLDQINEKVAMKNDRIEITPQAYTTEEDTEETSYNTDSSNMDDFDDLKSVVKDRFKKEAKTEKELEEKFNDEYKEKEKTDLNFLQAEKKRQYELKDNFDQISDLILPGNYVRIKMSIDHTPSDLLIIGAYLPSENVNIVLKGQLLKNKWQKSDLKSNAPFFFSMGWFRFQSIPLFIQAGKALKYCRESSELLFYGPSVPVGTGFFIFSFDSQYRILGSGQVLDTSGSITAKKKLKLIGYPRTIIGNNVIVQSMFSSNIEADKFTSAKIATASGLRGLIKTSVGKDGCFRSTFEGSLLMSDIIFLKCFITMKPYEYAKHIVSEEQFVRPLRSIREDMGLPLFEESISEETVEDDPNGYIDEDRTRKTMRRNRELKALERELPFGQRSIHEVRETVDLPIPPEQRKAVEHNQAIENKRKMIEQKAEDARIQKLETRKKKNSEMGKEKAERKRKNAVQGYLDKKKHKTRKRK